MHNFFLLIYYAFAQFIPMQPVPGWRIGYALRTFLCRKILKSTGSEIVCKDRCYFGRGDRLTVGNRSQLGQNARLNGTITIGRDVIMGPDVVMMSTSHGYERTDLPINKQEKAEKPITIGDDVWIGTRVIILPGVTIGSHSIIGAGAVVTKSFPEFSVLGGNPAKLIKQRASV
ncbi:MAG: acyltransferase [Desulfobulbaceae bacterium]|nr:acyltransferase [Desulfobulbaceae bacterium]